MPQNITDIDAYQAEAHSTSHRTHIGGDVLVYPVLALAGETGELANKIKKAYRDEGGYISEEARAAMLDELGDVLWYVAEIATSLNTQLSAVATGNIAKIQSRARRNVISGEGDNR